MKPIGILAFLIFACFVLLGCADTPTQPALTESEIEALIAERVAQELAKMQTDDGALSPQQIAEIALRSTVLIRVESNKRIKSSGFVVATGLIATTYHNIAGMKAGSVEMVESDEQHAIEKIAAVDESHDLVILKVSNINAPPLKLADSDKVRIGDAVYVSGNPIKYRATFSAGIVSGFEPSSLFVANKVLQITAPVSPGK